MPYSFAGRQLLQIENCEPKQEKRLHHQGCSQLPGKIYDGFRDEINSNNEFQSMLPETGSGVATIEATKATASVKILEPVG